MIQQLIWPILLQLLGIVVIIAEFLLPSAGILTVSALVLFGYSLYLVFANAPPIAGFIFLFIDILLIPVLVIVGIKLLAVMPVTLRKNLNSKDGTTAQPFELASLKGETGTVLTDLRPAGTILIKGKRHDAVSDGEYIDKDSEVIVSIVDGNRVVVKRKQS
jgi:membrane-bound serine protease (ClpP class)